MTRHAIHNTIGVRHTSGLRRALVLVIALGSLVMVRAPHVAVAESNGVGLTPAMGWSSWSFLRTHPTQRGVEAQARALVSTGLARLGYRYVNVDLGWNRCSGLNGPPAVDRFGRWVPNRAEFPKGIKAVADYVHRLHLLFGLYVTPGISREAVAEHRRIKGTDYHAEEIATSMSEYNFDCGGMVGIDYADLGAQAFIDSWAREFASWGVDYVKLDGVGSWDIQDLRAWSRALRRTGRAIHLELSNVLSIADSATWARYANGWRTGPDIECYCSTTGFPLTDWPNVALRFDEAAQWASYGRP